MKIAQGLSKIVSNVRGGISRFSTAFVLTFLIFAVTTYSIISDCDTHVVSRILYSLSMALIISVLFRLISEKVGRFFYVSHISGAAAFVSNYIILTYAKPIEEYYQMCYFGIIIAAVCVITALLFTDENSELLIPYIVKNSIFTVLVAAILSAGVSLCLWAFNVLLLSSDNFYKTYEIALAFIWFVIFANMFLAYLPKKGEVLTIPKVFKTIVAYVALPVYILLMAVLYAYLIKILITRNMPVGQINWFASYASLFFVFFVFNVRQYSDKFTKTFTGLIGYFIIPVVIMQLAAIYQRVSAYGLTTPRSISLILVLISIIFALYSIFGRKLEHVFRIIAVIVLAVTVIPKINVIDLPKQSQTVILETALKKYSMLDDSGNIVPIKSADIPDSDKNKILSSFGYLRSAAGEVPKCVKNTEGGYDPEKLFGFEYPNMTDSDTEYLSYSSKLQATADISEFKTLVKISSSSEVYEYSVNSEKRVFDCAGLLNILRETYGSNSDVTDMVRIDENTYFLVDDAYADYDISEKKFLSVYVNGILFIK